MTAAVLLLALLACGDKDDGSGGILDGGAEDGGASDTGDTGPTVDSDCPDIEHEEIADGQLAGEAVDINATVTDPSGVFLVELYFKKETSTTWTRLNMNPIQAGSSDYAQQIPASSVGSGGMDYYIKASDQLNNECTLPLEGEDDPFHFRVSAD